MTIDSASIGLRESPFAGPGAFPGQPRSFANNGFDAIHVAEIGMERAEDILILEKARTDDSVCVTLDHDFHAHLAIAGKGRPSVVLLRVEGLGAQGQQT